MTMTPPPNKPPATVTTSEQPLNPLLLTREQVAYLLNIRPEAVYHLHRVGRLRGVRISKELRWARQAVDVFVRGLEDEVGRA